jgi:hypothetical protein
MERGLLPFLARLFYCGFSITTDLVEDQNVQLAIVQMLFCDMMNVKMSQPPFTMCDLRDCAMSQTQNCLLLFQQTIIDGTI